MSAALAPLARDLAAIVGDKWVVTADMDRAAYSRDCWPLTVMWTQQGRFPNRPDAVVWPGNVDEVAAVVKYCGANAVPLVPYGAGSGVVGGAVPIRGGITLDMKRLDRLRAVDRDRLTCDAEAGIVGEVLEQALNQRGVTLGHFPSSIYCSTLGGWLAARSAGQLSSRYGKIEDMVLSLTAVDGEGHVLRAGPETAGPDLVQILVGSEGTLGVITDASLRVNPVPEHRALRGLRFPTLEAGVECMRRVFREGLRPSVMRLYDPFDTLLVARSAGGAARRKTPELPSALTGLVSGNLNRFKRRAVALLLSQPAAVNRFAEGIARSALLVLGFEGPAIATEEEMRAALAIASSEEGEDLGEAPGRRWLERRYHVSYKLSPTMDAGAWADTMEVATTWDRLAALYAGVRAAVSPHAFIMAHFSHAYLEGCSIYFTFAGPAPDPETAERTYAAAWDDGLTAAADAGATLAHHHGIGMHKQKFLPREHGESGMRVLRALKSAFDPRGILNPGKVGM